MQERLQARVGRRVQIVLIHDDGHEDPLTLDIVADARAAGSVLTVRVNAAGVRASHAGVTVSVRKVPAVPACAPATLRGLALQITPYAALVRTASTVRYCALVMPTASSAALEVCVTMAAPGLARAVARLGLAVSSLAVHVIPAQRGGTALGACRAQQ